VRTSRFRSSLRPRRRPRASSDDRSRRMNADFVLRH
jgi:hypothetical protein